MVINGKEVQLEHQSRYRLPVEGYRVYVEGDFIGVVFQVSGTWYYRQWDEVNSAESFDTVEKAVKALHSQMPSVEYIDLLPSGTHQRWARALKSKDVCEHCGNYNGFIEQSQACPRCGTERPLVA